jgi:predicted dehydrogenase
LLVEKPISHSTTGVQKLIDRCRQENRLLALGYNLRFSPSLNHFKAYLSEGRVGKIFSVRSEVGQYLPSWRPQADYRKGVSARRELGGGVLLELSHDLDYLRWIFGEVLSAQVLASKQSDLEIDVEDTAHVLLKFESGLTARLDMDFVRHDRMRQCIAIGKTGSLKWDALRGSIEVYEAGASQWEVLFEQKPEPDETYVAEWKNLQDCIDGHTEPRVMGEDGLAVLKMISR